MWVGSPNFNGRGGARVTKLAVHTAEGAREAVGLGRYFQNPAIEASSHDGSDNDKTVQYVDYGNAAWTLLNGNPISENLELCGFAHWTRAEWLNNNRGILDQCAAWLARRAVARGIPLVKLSPADVDAGKSGVIGHSDWTYSNIGWGNHTDPGVHFPWDYVIDRARAIAGGQAPPSGGGGAPAPAPKPAVAWPLPAGHYFGDITGPDQEHGGINAQEAVWVRQIQQALIRNGAVSGVSDINNGWADGRWEQETTDAMRNWQARVGYRVTGDCYQVDWDLLVIGKPSSGAPQNPPPSAPPQSGVPAFPLPRNHYFGDINGPNESHGGFYASERPWIKMIQQALIRKGFVPGVTDPNSSWADGKYERQTTTAVTLFQRAQMPNTTLPGQVWWDDWAKLLG